MKSTMKIIDRKLSDIKPYERNPRNNKKAVEKVVQSFKEFGVRWPILIDKDGIIICGHTRYAAAKELGYDTIPTMSAEDMTPEQVKAFRLIDNKTGEYATWDFDLLKTELADIFDIDMAAFDFTATSDVDELYKGMPEYEDGNANDRRITMHFRNEADVQDFAQLIGQTITDKTSFLWHPKMEREDKKSVAWEDE